MLCTVQFVTMTQSSSDNHVIISKQYCDLRCNRKLSVVCAPVIFGAIIHRIFSTKLQRNWVIIIDYEIESQHTESIRQHYSLMLEILDVEYSGLFAELLTANVIDRKEKEELQSAETSTQKIERHVDVKSEVAATFPTVSQGSRHNRTESPCQCDAWKEPGR